MNNIYCTLFFVFQVFLIHAQPCQSNVVDPTRVCDAYPVLCNLQDMDDYCGRTGLCQYPDCDPMYIGWCDGGFSIENPSHFSFYGREEIVEIILSYDNCVKSKGLQIAVYESCDSVYYNPIDCDANCGVAQGQQRIVFETRYDATYVVLIDGCEGDRCDYRIDVVRGTGTTKNVQFPDNAVILSDGEDDFACVSFYPYLLDFFWITVDGSNGIDDPFNGSAEYLWFVNGERSYVNDRNYLAEVMVDSMQHEVEICVQAVLNCGTTDLLCKTFFYDTIQIKHTEICVCPADFPILLYDSLIMSPGIYVFKEEDNFFCTVLDTVTIELSSSSFVAIDDFVCAEALREGYIITDPQGRAIDTVFDAGVYDYTSDSLVAISCQGRSGTCSSLLTQYTIHSASAIRNPDKDSILYLSRDHPFIILDTSWIDLQRSDQVNLLYIWSHNNDVLSRDSKVVIGEKGTYQLMVQAVNRLDFTEFCVLGVFDFQVKSLRATKKDDPIDPHIGGDIVPFPNPADQFVYLKVASPKKVSSLQLTDINGKVLFSAQAMVPKISLDPYKPGLYFISWVSDGKPFVKRFIKN